MYGAGGRSVVGEFHSYSGEHRARGLISRLGEGMSGDVLSHQ